MSTSPPRGQHFTPSTVADFIWSLLGDLGVRRSASIIDPAAGQGALLRAAVRWGAAREACVGLEIDAVVIDSTATRAGVRLGDGLLDAHFSAKGFDVVIGNPPFGRVREILSAEQIDALVENPLRRGLWGPGRDSTFPGRAVEPLFLLRAVDLARPGGVVAFILPDGFLCNRRLQGVRDCLLDVATPIVVVALPAGVFRRRGLNASTHVVVLRKAINSSFKTEMVERRHVKRGRLPETLQHMRADVANGKRTISVAAEELRGRRWDPGFWQGREALTAWSLGETVRLGNFIEHLTYGPIVTGEKAAHVPDGVRCIRQGDFTDTGLRRTPQLCVYRNSVHDPSRSRVRQGDLLLPRSGAGSLGKNRLAVYLEERPANVGCFVDVIRLKGINPFFVWAFLRSRPGWAQIRAVINGVGTPNISFDEIRALRLPPLPRLAQERMEQRYRQEVLDLHLRGEDDERAAAEAGMRFAAVVEDLEAEMQD
ncbi:MAG: N-6 DNA methylase [Candidatus Latescibacterota bacterium]|nr:N-6 DNA methylase [Candidatus Latescibacterota bacterium]